MTEIEALLERQARWQKARKDLSWPEKISMAEKIRASVATWCPRKRGEGESGAQAGPSRAGTPSLPPRGK